MRGSFLAALAAASVISVSAPALGATLIPAVFDFSNGASNNNISNGNARYFKAVSSQLGTFNVRATAWSLQTVGSNTYIRDSKLMVYDGGLGVINDNDNGGANNQHTIDNSGWKDFIVLQFDRKVQLISAQFTTFSVNGALKDSDATVMHGVTNINYQASLASNLNDKLQSSLNTLFAGSYSSLASNGNTNTRDINPNGRNGNIWLIGANFINADGRVDGFKIDNLAVIPEPATWAMTIAGFGMIGAALRRRSRPTVAYA